MKQILVDGRWEGDFGIGRYSREVLRHWNVDRVVTRSLIPPASICDPIWLRWAIASAEAKVFFSPGFNAALTDVHQLLTIHDLIHLDVAAESSPTKRLYYSRVVRPAIRRAGLVITVSEFSKARICEWSGLAPSQVVVAPGGCSAAFLREGDSLSEREHSSSPYVIFVGTNKPHKNARILMEVAMRLPDIRVIAVGLKPNDFPQVRPLLDNGRVVFKQGVSDGELADLYRGALCHVMPSSYEGWGLPALEALGCGTPTVYMCDAIGEVVGEYGVRLPSSAHPQTIVEAIELLARGSSASASTQMRVRAREYSWDKTARVISDSLTEFAA